MVTLAVSVLMPGLRHDEMAFVPIWLAYGLWPWYAILAAGVLCLCSSWLTARQWQTGIFLWETRQ